MNHGDEAMRLLAPAGDREALRAALEAGAESVYFGLTSLNARRRARNIPPGELPEAVGEIHAHAAAAFLTLNIDLGERDLGRAARMLALAQESGADAVIVRDPGLLPLMSHVPRLQAHFSTQAGMTSSADMRAAAALGMTGGVLARELTLAEIAAASVDGCEAEAFVQGALCFCISGRCLLSSWGGGRSGNRGACTSPCRVPWTIGGEEAGTPLAMHDLAALRRLPELARAGVKRLKIEGRLKNAAWVEKAVTLYRRVLAGESPADMAGELAELARYSGRDLTDGYLDGERDNLTGEAGRPETMETQAAGDAEAQQENLYTISILVDERGIACTFDGGGLHETWRLPKTKIRRPEKAVSVADCIAQLADQRNGGWRLGEGRANEPEFLLTPRAVNAVADKISACIHRLAKAPNSRVEIDLPQPLREALDPPPPHARNARMLGESCDRVRLSLAQCDTFLEAIRPTTVVVEHAAAAAVAKLVSLCGRVEPIVALPPVLFESDLPRTIDLLQACKAAGVRVEVNSWGGWWLALEIGVEFETGPHLPVLNRLAAQALGERGAGCVTLSLEADREQLEAVTKACPAPCTLIVYGRPLLCLSRVRMQPAWFGKTFADRRGLELTLREEDGLAAFRPVRPFDWSRIRNRRIKVAHLAADLVAAADPVKEWRGLGQGRGKVFRFNYDRGLY